MAFTYKVLGQSAPADTNNAALYTVPTGKSAIISAIHVANVTGAAVNARLFVQVNGATAAVGNAIAYDVSIAANSVFALSEGITLAAADVISVRSSVGSALTFTLFGSEIS